MTLIDERPVEERHPERRTGGILSFLTTTDHKKIGVAYMVTAFVFFLIGGAMAEMIRAQLAQPDLHLVTPDTYDQLFTMHGTIMLLLFVGPFSVGLANYFVPLQIGARDMAFPRLNALAYWLTLEAGIVMLGGFLTADGAAKFGWYGYTPLSDGVRSPGVGGDLWIVGIALLGLAGVLTALNVIATIICMRAPGLTMFRLPVFTWNMLVTSLLILMTFPVLSAAGVMLFADRHLDAHIFDANNGGVPILWQHLFWWFGHPEVYILILPFFGVFTEIFAVFSRRPVFGYKGFIFATMAIGFLSIGVWAHHMFTTGAVLVPFFSGATMLIAVPTGIKFFNWIGTLWGGKLNFKMPLVWGIGFMVSFLLGGLTGPMLASAPIDFHLSDSYFVVAHFHYVLFGGSVFGVFAACYYWFPKITGRLLHEGWGLVHFLLTFVGFHMTFFVQHILGLRGMPRRLATYAASNNWGALNLVSSIGAFIMGVSIFPFVWNVWRSLRRGEIAGDNPWDGQTLEWWTTSPPSPTNFDRATADPIGASGVGRQPSRPRTGRAVTRGTRLTALLVVALVGAGVMYGAWSNVEWSGTVLFVLTAGFVAIAGGYVALQARLHRTLGAPAREPPDGTAEHDDDLYLPHASIWPFELGTGTTLTLLGFVLGRVVLVFGLAVTAHTLVGWIGQSRRRD